ncbi:methylmalonate-semialdehyde dehydrogenase (acylating) [Colletotrichum cuscutae]|uniref:Methylmalonate-semialdehyde dehydrogenase (Acylating) n=1 Tax=Colletotrichum cuscutae TaxID=1209917 RepID=A0AAJ0DMJ6_9PEZI|nr:methylmalonate-semialdehyde dehydrogenase (acylating) [Colletotrichum cuscutae]
MRSFRASSVLRTASAKPSSFIALSSPVSSCRRALSTTSSARSSWPTSHTKIPNPSATQNFIDNTFKPSSASNWIDVHDPATNNVVTRVPESTDEELEAAVESAQRAFPAWKATSILKRQ